MVHYLLLIFLITPHTTTQSNIHSNNLFGIIFDAGSTGTRLNIFKVNDNDGSKITDKNHKELPIKFIKKLNCKITFSFQTDLNEAKLAINTCITMAIKLLDSPSQDINIWAKFVGTGGLRTLRNSDKNKFQELMEGIERLLKSIRSITPFNGKYVEVVEESAEAELDYIYSIYVENTRNINERGVLDIGGSSFQFAIPIKETSLAPILLKQKTFNLFQKDYHYGEVSFKCGGVDNIKNYYLIGLMKESGNQKKPLQLQSPCHPKGFSQMIETKSFKNRCTRKLLGDMLLSESITIEGNYDKKQCEQKLMDAFCSDGDAIYQNTCILDKKMTAPISVPDIITVNLIGSWAYFANELNSQDYHKLKELMIQMIKNNDCFYNNVERCFNASYLVFISDFFVKPIDQGIISSKKSGWTLGKILVESKYIFPRSSNVTKTILISLLCIFILMIISALLYFFCIRKKIRTRHIVTKLIA